MPQNYEHLTNWQISGVFKDSLNSGPLPLQNGICMVFPAWFSVDWLAKHPEMMWVFWFLIFSLDSPLSYLISPCSPEIAACYFFLQCWGLNLVLGIIYHWAAPPALSYCAFYPTILLWALLWILLPRLSFLPPYCWWPFPQPILVFQFYHKASWCVSNTEGNLRSLTIHVYHLSSSVVIWLKFFIFFFIISYINF